MLDAYERNRCTVHRDKDIQCQPPSDLLIPSYFVTTYQLLAAVQHRHAAVKLGK